MPTKFVSFIKDSRMDSFKAIRVAGRERRFSNVSNVKRFVVPLSSSTAARLTEI